jgi:small subunit ribosomal protein S16
MRSLIIRFKPMGKAHNKVYRVVLAQKYRHVTKAFLEILGFYNPKTKECNLENNRIKELLANHTEVSESVQALFRKNGLLEKTVFAPAPVATATKKPAVKKAAKK